MIEEKKKRPFETYETTIEVADIVTPRNIHLRFQLPPGKTMEFKAGQFVQIFVPQKDGKPRRTSYSVASPPQITNCFELCVTKVEGGRSSTYLHTLKKGDKVTVMGPLGRFTLPPTPSRDIVFIATGSGIAPFRSMIGNLFSQNFDKTIYLLFGNRYDDDIIYKDEWDKWASEKPNFKLFLTLSRPEKWKGPKGYVGDKIEEFVPSPKDKDFYICGLSNMINAVVDKLKSLGVPESQIHFEKYD